MRYALMLVFLGYRMTYRVSIPTAYIEGVIFAVSQILIVGYLLLHRWSISILSGKPEITSLSNVNKCTSGDTSGGLANHVPSTSA